MHQKDLIENDSIGELARVALLLADDKRLENQIIKEKRPRKTAL
jgi:hypothetical protein